MKSLISNDLVSHPACNKMDEYIRFLCHVLDEHLAAYFLQFGNITIISSSYMQRRNNLFILNDHHYFQLDVLIAGSSIIVTVKKSISDDKLGHFSVDCQEKPTHQTLTTNNQNYYLTVLKEWFPLWKSLLSTKK